jgi:RNA recognition motif-containing protein
MATAFEQYGTIVDLSMPTDRKTGENKGYCFLQYQDSRSCDLAFNNMKGWVTNDSIPFLKLNIVHRWGACNVARHSTAQRVERLFALASKMVAEGG